MEEKEKGQRDSSNGGTTISNEDTEMTMCKTVSRTWVEGRKRRKSGGGFLV